MENLHERDNGSRPPRLGGHQCSLRSVANIPRWRERQDLHRAFGGEGMSGRARLGGGFSPDAAAPRGIYAPRDSILLPPSRPVFEAIEVSQAPLHKSTVMIDALAGILTGVGLVAAGFILLFVRL
jgi:hypothetical protein